MQRYSPLNSSIALKGPVRKPAIAEFAKYLELHRSEENLGRPEGKGSLKDGTGIEFAG